MNMRKQYYLLCSLLISTLLQAQAPVDQPSKWKIRLHNKVLINTTQESETVNNKKISKKKWKKNGFLEIEYKEADPDFWYRSFMFFDENDNELFRKDSTSTVKISLVELRKIMAGKKELHIYLGGSPRDPNIAVRMRRIHLCTLRV